MIPEKVDIANCHNTLRYLHDIQIVSKATVAPNIFLYRRSVIRSFLESIAQEDYVTVITDRGELKKLTDDMLLWLLKTVGCLSGDNVARTKLKSRLPFILQNELINYTYSAVKAELTEALFSKQSTDNPYDVAEALLANGQCLLMFKHPQAIDGEAITSLIEKGNKILICGESGFADPYAVSKCLE